MTQRPYRNIGFFFVLLLVLVILGFTPHVPDTPFFGYFRRITQLGHVPMVIHLHAIAAIGWFSLLCTQAFLIRENRVKLHRLLGKCSVVLVVLFLLTAIGVMKYFYAQTILTTPRNEVLSLLAQSFTALTLFIIFYTLALIKRRNIYWHVAFMVGAAIAAATPGLARLGLYLIGGLPGILTVVALMYTTLVCFLLTAKIKFKQPVLTGPYLPIIGLFLLAHAMDFVGSGTATWLWLADKITATW